MLAQHPELLNAEYEWKAGDHATGAHGIPLLAQAALSGDVALLEMLFRRGARGGVSYALHNAVITGHEHAARWLLDNGHPI